MTVNVQLVEAGDAAALERVAPGVFDGPVDPRWSAEFLADARHHLAVAIDDGVIVGMASAVHYVHPDKAPQLLINELGVAPTHQYSRGGTYTVTLTVTNDLGQSATASLTVPVSPNSIVADFTFSPTNPRVSTGTNAVIFDATPSSAGVTSWVWDFGDGSAAGTGQRMSHTFSRAGTWVVRLTVTDAAGRTATTIKNVPVID